MSTLILATLGGKSVFYGGSYRFYRLAGNTTLPTVLYAVGFACQVLGGVILLIGIRDDRRAAKRIPSRATWESVDVPAEVVKGRLGGHRMAHRGRGPHIRGSRRGPRREPSGAIADLAVVARSHP